MKKNTKTQTEKKAAPSLFTLTPRDLKAIYGGKGTMAEGPKDP